MAALDSLRDAQLIISCQSGNGLSGFDFLQDSPEIQTDFFRDLSLHIPIRHVLRIDKKAVPHLCRRLDRQAISKANIPRL